MLLSSGTSQVLFQLTLQQAATTQDAFCIRYLCSDTSKLPLEPITGYAFASLMMDVFWYQQPMMHHSVREETC